MKRSDITLDEVLAACDAFHSGTGPAPGTVLVDKGYPPKVVWARMQQLVDQGWLDYGVSLNTAWVARYSSDWPGHQRRSDTPEG